MSSVRPGRWRRRLVWAATVAALVVVVAVGTGWSPWSDDGVVTRVPDSQSGLDTRPGVDLYPADRRAPVPDVRGTSLEGKPLALADFRGKILVVNVWGSWCGPCRAETPDLVRLANETADHGVRFVGIDTRDGTAAAQAFVRRYQVPYPSIEDPQGQVLLRLQGVAPTQVVPSTLVVDRDGRIAARVIGPVTYPTLKGILDDELARAGGR